MDTSDPGSLPVSTLTGDPLLRVPATATLVEVAAALDEAKVGALVVGEEDRPAAILSERDVVQAVADGRDLATTTAADVGHADLAWSDAEAPVADVAALMMDRYIRHVLIERDGTLVGIVSARDLLGLYASS